MRRDFQCDWYHANDAERMVDLFVCSRDFQDNSQIIAWWNMISVCIMWCIWMNSDV